MKREPTQLPFWNPISRTSASGLKPFVHWRTVSTVVSIGLRRLASVNPSMSFTRFNESSFQGPPQDAGDLACLTCQPYFA